MNTILTMQNIPEGWRTKKVFEIAQINTGDKDTQNKVADGKYPFFVRSQTIERINSYGFDGEAVLTSGDGVGVGKIYHYVNGKFDYHQRVYNIHNFSDEILGKYFFLYFSSNFYKRISAMSAKNSVDSVRREMIANMHIHYPDKDEQVRIIAVLDTWDQSIEKLTRKIEIKKNVKKGLMQELLTGKNRLNGFNEGWETTKLGGCLTVKHGKTQREVESLNGKYPILGTGGEFGRATKFLYDKPSVLIGRKGTIDKPKYIDTPFWTVDTLFYSEIKKNYSPKFLYYVFLTINWKLYNEGSGVPSLSASTVSSIKILIPKEEKEQAAIADILTTADKEISELEKKLSILKDQKKYLLNNLITGTIRTPESLSISN